MYPAIFSRTYPSTHIDEVLEAISRDGFTGAQMNLSSFGMDALPDTLDTEALARGRDAAARLGVNMVALSGTYNMAHPDPAHRRGMRPGFTQVLRAARALAVPIVTVCTGSRDPVDKWAEHPDNSSPSAWRDFRAELDWALGLAGRHSIVLAVEPEPGNVVRDAHVARRMLDEVAAPNLKIVLDVANIVGASGLANQQAIIDEAVNLLGPDVVLVHAKDIDESGAVVAPGRGAIDLPSFVTAVSAAGYDGALVGHGFDHDETKTASRALAALCSTAPGSG